MDQIENLLSIFDDREKLMNLSNRRVAEVLTPTVLGALFELINLPSENVVWEDFQVVETVLVIRASITYDPAHDLSPFLNLIVPPRAGATPISVQKTIQFGIPLAKAFDDKEALKIWLVEVIKNGGEEAEPSPPDTPDHSDLSLTKEQVNQMLHLQSVYGTNKQ